jgi:hypothetical protein
MSYAEWSKLEASILPLLNLHQHVIICEECEYVTIGTITR